MALPIRCDELSSSSSSPGAGPPDDPRVSPSCHRALGWARPERTAAELRGDKGRRAEGARELLRIRLLVLHDVREAKVGDGEVVVGGDEEVARLEIAVDHALVVHWWTARPASNPAQ